MSTILEEAELERVCGIGIHIPEATIADAVKVSYICEITVRLFGYTSTTMYLFSITQDVLSTESNIAWMQRRKSEGLSAPPLGPIMEQVRAVSHMKWADGSTMRMVHIPPKW